MSTESFTPARQDPDPPPQGQPGAASSAEADLVSAAGLVPPPPGPSIPHPANGPLAAVDEASRPATPDASGSYPLPRREKGAQLPTGSWQAFAPKPDPASIDAANALISGTGGPAGPTAAQQPASPAMPLTSRSAMDAANALISGFGMPGTGAAPAADTAGEADSEPEFSGRELPTAGFRPPDAVRPFASRDAAPAAGPTADAGRTTTTGATAGAEGTATPPATGHATTPSTTGAGHTATPSTTGHAATQSTTGAEWVATPSTTGTTADAGLAATPSATDAGRTATPSATGTGAAGPGGGAATSGDRSRDAAKPAGGTGTTGGATGYRPPKRGRSSSDTSATAEETKPSTHRAATTRDAVTTSSGTDVTTAAETAPAWQPSSDGTPAFRPAGPALRRPDAGGAAPRHGVGGHGPASPSETEPATPSGRSGASPAFRPAGGAFAQVRPGAEPATPAGDAARPTGPARTVPSPGPDASGPDTAGGDGVRSAFAEPIDGPAGITTTASGIPTTAGVPIPAAAAPATAAASTGAASTGTASTGTAFTGTAPTDTASTGAASTAAGDATVLAASATPTVPATPAKATAAGDPEGPARTRKPLPPIRQAPVPEPVAEVKKEVTAPDDEDSSEESELEERRRLDRLALRRAEIRLAQGDAHSALAEASPAMARLSSDADVWLLMARIRIALDDIPGALKATETATALKPGAPAISAVISDALAATGRHAEAIANARAALEAEPGNPHWQHLVATRLVEAGEDRAEADKLARAAVAAMPDEPAFQATAVLTQGSRHRRGRGSAEPEVSTETALVPFRTAGANPSAAKADAGEDEKAPARRWAWGRGTGRALALPAGPSAAKPEAPAGGEQLVDFVESLKSDVPVMPGHDGVTVLEGETVPNEGRTAYRPPRPMPKLVTEDPGDKPWQRGGPASMTGTMRPGGPDWSALAGTRSWQQGTGTVPVVSYGAADARWPMARVGVTTALGAGVTYACLVLNLTETAHLAAAIALATVALMVIQFVWSSGAAGRRALGRAVNTVRRVLAAVLGLGAVVTLGLAAAGTDGRMPWLLAGAAAAGLLAAVLAATEPRSRRRTHGQR
ncbi:tetratricopeptide (TPR) repeat protein [Catenuloplanes nepalensis]|uniref:Tetratricopeptide (TPR) repeat protein n=1 Tax=Catenuloplanes nepalensis TaxID=587533 RepID=A0ABT9MTJ6_9ACTN|nr:hypothetical protein [Catenuloplanes nepalensis]MDP9794765.1 tetratricopeptide (TPR) repeat protein [Catenuloplanes nepalensis]